MDIFPARLGTGVDGGGILDRQVYNSQVPLARTARGCGNREGP